MSVTNTKKRNGSASSHRYIASGIGANSRVRVKIRPRAMAELWPDKDSRPAVDEDGFTRWQFWDLVRAVAPMMRWGAMVFDGQIEVESQGA